MLKPGIIVHCSPLEILEPCIQNPSVYGVFFISFPYQIPLNMGPKNELGQLHETLKKKKHVSDRYLGGWVYPNHPEYTLW